jgi:hypothetical protein
MADVELEELVPPELRDGGVDEPAVFADLLRLAGYPGSAP